MLVTKIKSKINNDVQIEIQHMNDDHATFLPDISLVKKELDLELKVDIDEALDKTINWAVKNI